MRAPWEDAPFSPLSPWRLAGLCQAASVLAQSRRNLRRLPSPIQKETVSSWTSREGEKQTLGSGAAFWGEGRASGRNTCDPCEAGETTVFLVSWTYGVEEVGTDFVCGEGCRLGALEEKIWEVNGVVVMDFSFCALEKTAWEGCGVFRLVSYAAGQMVTEFCAFPFLFSDH